MKDLPSIISLNQTGKSPMVRGEVNTEDWELFSSDSASKIELIGGVYGDGHCQHV
jgi:hypothetical protein